MSWKYGIVNAKKAFENEPRSYYYKKIAPAIYNGTYCYKTRRIKPKKRTVIIGFIEGLREVEVYR